jgi:hypothetical protein
MGRLVATAIGTVRIPGNLVVEDVSDISRWVCDLIWERGRTGAARDDMVAAWRAADAAERDNLILAWCEQGRD